LGGVVWKRGWAPERKKTSRRGEKIMKRAAGREGNQGEIEERRGLKPKVIYIGVSRELGRAKESKKFEVRTTCSI